ncbi:MAG: glycosyltransferase [Lactobacillus sp.]|nr:glycosyltransferase [Lactobacillus sp.]
MYKLSVIIPVYNAQSSIRKCIKSIEDQHVTFDFEIIAVNDGSTDNSRNVLQQLAVTYPNIVLVQQANLKQAAARNNGLIHASGKYVMFVDSDDYILPGMFQAMITRMDAGDDLVVCGIQKTYSDHTEIENISALVNEPTRDALLCNYLTRNQEFDVGVWGKAFRMKLIQANNLSFKNKNFFEDSFFVLQYMAFCNFERIEHINNAFYVLIKQSGTTTGTLRPEITALAQDYIREVSDFLKQRGVYYPIKYQIGFKKRILIHLVHHHLKYDMKWSWVYQRDYLKHTNINVSNLGGMSTMPIKYSLAYLMIKYVPALYSKLYLKK